MSKLVVYKRGKKALYEVIGKTWPKASYAGKLEKLRPEVSDHAVSGIGQAAVEPQDTFVRWPKRAPFVRYNAGRFEFSLPYQLAIAFGLAIVLLCLAVFRLGQLCQKGTNRSLPQSGFSSVQSVSQLGALAVKKVGTDDEPETVGTESSSAGGTVGLSGGGNRIVIQSYHLKSHLEPVRDYFASFGIETEIKQLQGRYLLVTKGVFQNPGKPGTDGFVARQEIIDLGAKYEAPEGYEKFGPRPFYDAYGMKFDE